MSIPTFPTLLGLTYPVPRRTLWNNIVQKATSGIETRIANWSYPLYEWDLTFDWLSAAAAQTDFQALAGFYEQVYGNWAMFLFDDNSDDSTVASQIGVGDGTTTVFQLSRTLGSASIPIYNPKNSPTPITYVNAVVTSSTINYTLGTATFGSAPGSGLPVTATFSYYFGVRFLEEEAEWQNIAQYLWQNRKLSLRMVRQAG